MASGVHDAERRVAAAEQQRAMACLQLVD